MSSTTGEKIQKLRVGARTFYVLPKSEYDRLVREAKIPQVDATAFARASIGRDLRRKRKRAGLTQAEVAARAGVRLETLSRLENGRGNPTVDTVQRILGALGERA